MKQSNEVKKGLFKSFIPLSTEDNKTKIFTKEIGGKTVKYLRGIATNTLVDKENERMSKQFIDKIKQTVLGLNVFSEHTHTIDKTLGFVDEVTGDDDSVIIDTALEDDNENVIVKSILNKINHGTKIGYSIGGRILKAKKVYDDTLKKFINEIEDGEIYEVSLTALPAGVGTWVEPIQKSLGEFLKDNVVEPEPDEIKKQFTKALDEMLQENKVRDEIWEMFYAFREMVYMIVSNTEMTPEQKKLAINKVSEEFGNKIEILSAQIVDLSLSIEEQLGMSV